MSSSRPGSARADGRPLTVNIVGAGPAGLAAALTVAKAGGRAILSERHADVGRRFHGDFQGLENWTTSGDVLDELVSGGIEPTFESTPFRECIVFDPSGAAYTYRSPDPMWYLIRRGAETGTLDYALKEQAVSAGVELRFGRTVEHLPDGGIVAHGPHRPDVIAVGYVFETDQADGAYAVVSDQLAPKGYAYLLVCSGRGTIASCMFADFHNEKLYRERTVEFFQDRVGLDMSNPRPFGGFGNVEAAPVARKGNLLYVGEAAGFQDALFGFGIRYALLSGQLAARAWIEGEPERYDQLWRQRLDGVLRLALVNRYLYDHLGNRGYARLMRRIDRAQDARQFLRRWYTAGTFRSWLYPLARRKIPRGRRELLGQCPAGCDCTWCRCAHGSSRHADPATAAQ